MNRPRWSPWISGSTRNTPPTLSLSLTCTGTGRSSGSWSSLRSRPLGPFARWARSFDVDLAMVADHQAQRPRAGLGSGHDRFLADQGVLEARDVDDPRPVHHDR